MKRTGLILNVGDILDGKVAEKTINFSEVLDKSDPDLALSSPVKGAVRFIPTDGGLVGLFHIQTALNLLCSTDGQEYIENLNLRFSHEFSGSNNPDASSILADRTVDISPVLWDEIVVNVPMKPLCPAHKR